MQAKLVFVLLGFISLAQNALDQYQLAVATRTRTPIPFTEYSVVLIDPLIR